MTVSFICETCEDTGEVVEDGGCEGSQAFRCPRCEGESHLRARIRDLEAQADARRLGEHWSFVFDGAGSHVHITIRVGTPGSRALAGRITLRSDEADELRLALGLEEDS